MSFLSVIFLLGLPLLAVPIAIHLLSRRRQEVVKWGAMQFLMDSRIRRRKIWRLDDLILMLLRTLAVLGIVLALSRPIWHGSGLENGLGRDVVFIWDVSMSVERQVDGEHSSFDHLVQKTTELMAQLGSRDTVRGMVTLGRGKWLTTDSLPASHDQKEFLVQELKKVGVTQSSADWVTCVGTALRVTPPRNATAKLIVVLSDGQAHGWRQQDPSAWQNLVRLTEESKIPIAIELYNVNSLSSFAAHNLAIDKMTTVRQLTGVGESISVDAEIHNYGQTPVENVTVSWTLGDVSLGRSSFGPVAAGQSRQVPFKTVMQKTGVSQLRCRLELRDDLPSDNERTLIVETVDNVPLLLVDDTTEIDPLKSDKGYLLAALGHDPSGGIPVERGIFRVQTCAAKELAEHSLAGYRAIIFANTPNLDEEAGLKLMDFVRGGGGLWLALGDRTGVGEFNEIFYRAGGGLSPWPISEAKGDLIRREDFLTIHPPERDHPATILLSDTQRLDIDRVQVFQRFPFVVTAAKMNVPVLLRSGTGEALVVESFLGRGRIFVQSLPMGVRWCNLPLTQAYVPLVHEWLWYLMQPTAISRNLQPGEPLQALLPPNEHVREVQIKRPDGITNTLPTYKKGDQLFAQSRETQQPGSYEVIMKIEGKDDQVQPYQVTRAAEESNLDEWTPELTARWNNSPSLRLNPSTTMVLPKGASGQRLGEPLSTTLLLLVVLAFLGELWLVRRIAKKRFAGSGASSGQPGNGQPFGQMLGTRGAV